MHQPRLRVIAGPNGSGKTSLLQTLQNKNINLGQYLNPDFIHASIEKTNELNLNDFNLSCSNYDLISCVKLSSFPAKIKLPFLQNKIKIDKNKIIFSSSAIGSYSTALIVEFLREEFLKKRSNFTIETVFSHKSKVDLLEKAKNAGYKSYLYFINTTSVEINKERVKSRVLAGGHNVPKEKITKRYKLSLNLLFAALPQVYRAYFFDNSGAKITNFAEMGPDKKIYINENSIPWWFNDNVLSKIK